MGSIGKNSLTSQSVKYSISNMTLSRSGYVNHGGAKSIFLVGYLSKNLVNFWSENLIHLIVVIQKKSIPYLIRLDVIILVIRDRGSISL
jgi:hypothetical protein